MVVQDAMEDLELSDIWRIFNPDSKRFTWRQRQAEIQRRLDFFLVSQTMLCNCSDTDIIPGFKTDHSMTDNTQPVLTFRPRGKWFLETKYVPPNQDNLCGENKRNYARNGY